MIGTQYLTVRLKRRPDAEAAALASEVFLAQAAGAPAGDQHGRSAAANSHAFAGPAKTD